MIDLLTSVGAVTAAMMVVLVAAAAVFGAARRTRATFGRSGARQSKRLTLVVSAALLLAFAVSYFTAARATNTQAFALSGAERWTVGPFLYVTFALLLLGTHGSGALGRTVSKYLRSTSAGLTLLVLVTGFIELLLGSTTALQTVQGLALLVGFSLFMVVGSSTREWDAVTRRLFLVAVVGAGLLTVALRFSLGSFPALAVPAGAAAMALATSSRISAAKRLVAILVGAGSLVLLFLQSADSNDPSAGLQLQIGIAVAIAVVASLPLRTRVFAGLVFASGIVWAIGTSSLAQITFGGLADDPDLTIAQRGYETQAVWSAVSSSPLTFIFGLGPGATVDLHSSPDAATLLASGRDLFHVPSVHLLTSYVLLKTGVLGLIWLALIFAKLLTLTVSELRQPRPDALAVLLLCLPWCGLAAAIPAATFFFSNPLCALGIGLLIARSETRRTTELDTHITRTSRLRGISTPITKHMDAASRQYAVSVGIDQANP
jgi:hypothetical protein